MKEEVNSKIDKIFSSFVKDNLFKDKHVLQISYTPETIPHRDEQIEQIASILAPVLRGERTSNLFVYGKTGTGKTLSVQCVRNELLKRNDFGWALKIYPGDSKKSEDFSMILGSLKALK